MKTLVIIVAVLVVGAAGFYFLGRSNPIDSPDAAQTAEAKTVVADGSYRVIPAESQVRWAGKKPLIEGYTNSGSISVAEGTIEVADQSRASGRFVIDMNTISVTATPAKPGQESALGDHLRGKNWFDVATHPTATFELTEVTPRADSATTFVYDVRGNLTMKGQTHELTFPATIYMDEAGKLRADASLEFDRTKWGLTMASGSFFDNLANNAIDDMVALSFNLVAEKQ